LASLTSVTPGLVQRIRSRRTPRAKWRRRSGLIGLLFIWPALLLYIVFSVYPILRTVEISFTNWDGLSNGYTYVGWANYVTAFKDTIWWESLWHGVIFSVMALVFMNGIGLLLAVIVDSTKRGSGFYRALFYLPPVLSGVVVALIFKWLYEPYGGPLNAGLQSIGLTNWTHAWLGDSKTAIWCVSIASIWAGVGYPFLLFLAGLQGVPKELYEAAQLDGANAWKQFRHVTVPFLVPVGAIVNILTILGAMQLFNIVIAMTGGGPGYATEVPVLHIYREAFKSTHFGYATALSMVFGAILFIISIVQLKLSRRFGVRAS
jgi:ABC-type sugar transport system permease subunit